MPGTQEDASVVAQFLASNRSHPPEREGWYSSYEIQSGILAQREEKLRSARLFHALNSLLTSQPPAIEDAWMRSGPAGPITDEQYTYPAQPPDARRYYRALGSVPTTSLSSPEPVQTPAFDKVGPTELPPSAGS